MNEIWLGDLLEAWRGCGAVTPEERMMVASLLGFARSSAPASSYVEPYVSDPQQRPQRPIVRQPDQPKREPEPLPPDMAARLVIVDRRRSSASDEQLESSGPSLPLETRAHIRYQPPLEPLFESQYQRQILYALAATMAHEGDFDVDWMVDQLARGTPLRNAARRPVLTLRHGVQLLLDRGQAMTLFFGDERALLTSMRLLAGPERVHLLHFSECPTRTRYDVPPPRTKIIVVSDFGISPARGLQRPSSPDEWAAFAELVRAAECDLIGLVPYPPHRWPRGVAASMKLVQWDRPTRFSVVRQRAMREQP